MPIMNPRLTGTEAQKEEQLKALEKAYEERDAEEGHAPADTGGLGTDLNHKAKLDDNGLIGAVFAHLYRLFIELIFNLHYFKKLFQFKRAQKEGRAYEEGAANNPDIYPIDEKTGKPNFRAAPLAADKITHLAVLLNRCTPKPTVGQGILDAIFNCAAGIAGPGVLHQAQRLQLFGTTQTDAAASDNSNGLDLQAINAARMAANRTK